MFREKVEEEITLFEVLDILGELSNPVKQHKASLIQELDNTVKEMDSIEILESEMKAIEETVKLGLLKDFKIHRVMMPQKYNDRTDMLAKGDELKLQKETLTEKLQLLEQSPSKYLKKNSDLFTQSEYKDSLSLMEVLTNPYCEALLGGSLSGKHMRMSLVKIKGAYREKYKLNIIPTTMVANIFSGFSMLEMRWHDNVSLSSNYPEISELAPRIEDGFEETMQNAVTFLNLILNSDGTSLQAFKPIAKIYLSNIKTITPDILLEYCSELHYFQSSRTNYFVSQYMLENNITDKRVMNNRLRENTTYHKEILMDTLLK